MTTPPGYVPDGLWGGVRDNIQNNIDFTGDCQAALNAGMSAENRRRQMASQSPGLGALLPLPAPPSGPGVGIADLDPAMPVAGEGYDTVAEIAVGVHKAYGAGRPQYADPVVGGLGYADGIAQPARRSSLFEVEGQVFMEQPGHAGSTVLISPATAPKRTLWNRLLGKFRR